MKKQNWILLIFMVLFTAASMQQNVYNFKVLARGGISIGDDSQSGTNTVLLDTVGEIATNTILGFSAGDSMLYYTPFAFRSTDDPMVKAPGMDTKTDNYTLVIGDAFKWILMNKGTTDTLFIPLNASVAFPLQTQVSVISLGAGDTYVSPISGATLNGAGDAIQLSAQWKWVTFVKYGTDAWALAGGI